MKKHSNRPSDKLTSGFFRKEEIEIPSEDFVDNVMHSIESLPIPEKQSHEPLLSNRIWASMAAVAILILVLSFSGNIDDLGILESIDLINLKELSPSIEISRILFYGILGFGLMFGIQIYLIKNYFGKRLTY